MNSIVFLLVSFAPVTDLSSVSRQHKSDTLSWKLGSKVHYCTNRVVTSWEPMLQVEGTVSRTQRHIKKYRNRLLVLALMVLLHYQPTNRWSDSLVYQTGHRCHTICCCCHRSTRLIPLSSSTVLFRKGAAEQQYCHKTDKARRVARLCHSTPSQSCTLRS